MNKLKLIKTEHFSGYLMEDVEKYLGKKSFIDFKKWAFGETVALYKNKELVYEYNLERYKKGLRPLDSF